MRRREFIALLSGTAITCPFAALAQHSTKPVTIGILASLPLPPIQSFRQKLQELGYVEGENLRLEYRFAEGRDDRYPAMAAELVALGIDVIITWGTPASLAAKHATTTVPIVIGAIGETVGTDVVSSLAHPGGNITGFSSMTADTESKRLELLKEMLPNLSRVGMLLNPANPLNQITLQSAQRASESLSLMLLTVEIRDRDDVEGALIRLAETHPDAVLVAPDTLLLSKRKQIVEAIAERHLPAVYPFREYAEAGGLMVYGANLRVLFQRAAVYVDKILKGAKVGDLPIQQATEFELILNLETAKALGIEVPPAVLARADEVIE